jgi:hypothetical protein
MCLEVPYLVEGVPRGKPETNLFHLQARPSSYYLHKLARSTTFSSHADILVAY